MEERVDNKWMNVISVICCGGLSFCRTMRILTFLDRYRYSLNWPSTATIDRCYCLRLKHCDSPILRLVYSNFRRLSTGCFWSIPSEVQLIVTMIQVIRCIWFHPCLCGQSTILSSTLVFSSLLDIYCAQQCLWRASLMLSMNEMIVHVGWQTCNKRERNDASTGVSL